MAKKQILGLIALNVEMILPHDENPDRMDFSEKIRIAAALISASRFIKFVPNAPSSFGIFLEACLHVLWQKTAQINVNHWEVNNDSP